MSGSIYRIEVGVSSANEGTLARCREIIEMLRERHEVTGEEAVWRVDYIDFETRDDAIKALRMELGKLAPDWQDFLVFG